WTREAIDRSISAFLELETTGIAELPVEILVGASAPDLFGLSAALDAQSALTLGVDEVDIGRLWAARSMLRWPAMRDWLSALGTQLRLARGRDDTVAMEAGPGRHPLQTV